MLQIVLEYNQITASGQADIHNPLRCLLKTGKYKNRFSYRLFSSTGKENLFYLSENCMSEPVTLFSPISPAVCSWSDYCPAYSDQTYSSFSSSSSSSSSGSVPADSSGTAHIWMEFGVSTLCGFPFMTIRFFS